MVSYAEHGSDEEDDDDEEESEDDDDPASDPEDTSYGRGGGKRRRDVYDPQAGARQNRLKKKKDDMDRGWTWLGDRCPGERVRSQRVAMTKHHYQYVFFRLRLERASGLERKLTSRFRSTDVLEVEANKREVLIPITIDFDVPSANPELGGIKIKDRFLWNLNGKFDLSRVSSSGGMFR